MRRGVSLPLRGVCNAIEKMECIRGRMRKKKKKKKEERRRRSELFSSSSSSSSSVVLYYYVQCVWCCKV